MTVRGEVVARRAGVVPTAVDDIHVPGSDHRGFVVDVAVNP